MHEIRTELAVVGAGPAGICAAIASARLGIKTLLIGNRPVVGGNSSSEIRVWTRGAAGAGNLYAEEMGVWGILKLRNLYRNPDGNPVFWSETLLDSLMQQENLSFYLNTEVAEIGMTEDNRVHWIGGLQQGTELYLKIYADYFIDATGDGRLGAQAGSSYYMGNQLLQGKYPEKIRNVNLQGNTILYFTRREDYPVRFVAPDYAYRLEEIETILGQGGRVINEKMSGSDCWWFEYGGVLNTITDAQEIMLELKRLVMGVWNYIKNSGKFDADHYTLEWIGNLPGKRESRRMCTAYMLSEADVRGRKLFPDGAFYGGWYMDFHPPGGIMDSGADNCVQIPVEIYQIPLRCLYHKQIPNLLFAGRDIGTEQGAFASSRVMNTCALSGQAAGTMAALGIQTKRKAGDISPEEVGRIQSILLREDMFIPGIREQTSRNLAVSARVSASSWNDGAPGCEAGRLQLAQSGFLLAPGRAGKLLAFRLHSSAKEAVEIQVALYLSELPNRFTFGTMEKVYRIWVNPGEQTVGIRMPDKSEGMFCKLVFQKTDAVSLVLSQSNRTGFLCGYEREAEYREPFAGYAECIINGKKEKTWTDDSIGGDSCNVAWRYTDEGFYRPEEVLNGYWRPWGRPNQWCAAREDVKPWIQLDWEEPVPVQEIRIWLDPELAMELPSSRAHHWEMSHHLTARKEMPPQLIKDFVVEIRRASSINKQFDVIFKKQKNEQRLIVIRLKEKLQSLRFCVKETWGKRTAAVYGIAVYQEKTNRQFFEMDV